MPIELPAHFHVGIVVADLRAARVRLTEQLGVRWGPVMHLDAADYRDGRGRDLAGEVEVLSGLRAGETIVVDGAFLLKAQAEKGAGHHDEH